MINLEEKYAIAQMSLFQVLNTVQRLMEYNGFSDGGNLFQMNLEEGRGWDLVIVEWNEFLKCRCLESVYNNVFLEFSIFTLQPFKTIDIIYKELGSVPYIIEIFEENVEDDSPKEWCCYEITYLW